jgi:hypothetical protein
MNNIQIGNNYMVVNNKVWINGEEVPPMPTKRKNHCITQINDKVYIDGYEFKKGKWTRTLKALWYLWF